MANNKFFPSYFPIAQSKRIYKFFATAILVFAMGYPSSAQAVELNDKDFNNAFGQQSLEPEINTVGEQPLVVAQRYNRRRPQVRRTIIIGPRRRYRVRPIRRSRVQRVYRPVRRYRVQPVRRYNRYGNQRVYVR
ncbi:hypothetical protein [Brasilonema bromeliae]|uniref:Uncharacterized protein n=1 Tax=Brasilonema bromeliae SPC951 TaxID=385972 RepID=A0ABX1P807_9CYAN|nr:hypothetical protein [Brasilonema bromeliae]NMG20544.1 hypothetical protein [Brasilonema bromeliae SPC951]